jgi:hypothetical protein
MYGRGKSDSAIVAGKPTNKAGQPAAESVEPSAEAEGNASQQSTRRLHAHFVGWQTAIVRKEIALTSARAPRHLSGLADAKVEQHCHRYGHYDEH